MNIREILIVIAIMVILAFTLMQTVIAYRECPDGKIVRGMWHYECIR